MSGTEKLPLLVIGKSAKPRCFKNAHLPIEYMANTKSWMTGVIFESWLKAWDKKLKKNNRKILLYMDNCSSHPPKLVLHNISLKFFPLNTAAMSQPMDQGIIQNLKVHYRRFLLRERIKAIDEGEEFSFNLINAIHLLRRAWDDVQEQTVHNCFKKADFVIKDVELVMNGDLQAEGVNSNSGLDELLDTWRQLQLREEIEEDVSMDDFLEVDKQLITDGALTLEEIVEDVLAVECNELENSEIMNIDVEEVEVEEPLFTSLEAQRALKIVRDYVESNFTDLAILKHSDALDEFLYH